MKEKIFLWIFFLFLHTRRCAGMCLISLIWAIKWHPIQPLQLSNQCIQLAKFEHLLPCHQYRWQPCSWKPQARLVQVFQTIPSPEFAAATGIYNRNNKTKAKKRKEKGTSKFPKHVKKKNQNHKKNGVTYSGEIKIDNAKYDQTGTLSSMIKKSSKNGEKLSMHANGHRQGSYRS